MNKTKRKIFETSMKLFAEKGYDATSIEEITSVVGVAKGTLYYHFSSKEEIFNFLIEEGMKLLKNSITIKTEKQEKYIDKIKAIILIEIKIIMKYENFMSIVFSEMWGNSNRSNTCRKYVNEYLDIVKDILLDGMNSNEIKKMDVNILSSEILSIACASLYNKKNDTISIEKMFKTIERTFINPLKLNE